MRCCQILTSCLCTHWPLRSYYRCFTIHATNNLLLQVGGMAVHASLAGACLCASLCSSGSAGDGGGSRGCGSNSVCWLDHRHAACWAEFFEGWFYESWSMMNEPATHASLLQNNVGFDVQGHCFYIEVRGSARAAV